MFLKNKILGLELWIWILIGIIIVLLKNNKESFAEENNTEKIDINKTENVKIEPKQKFKFFNFNTSWCGWSKRFQPEWDNLVNKVNTDNTEMSKTIKDTVEFLDVKCDKNENIELCNKYDIPGYPFVLIENVNSGEKFVYNNERTADEMYKFLVNNIYNYVKNV
jgi:hypothetical protein